jgi:predicted Zn finger-like uncharacterized protein
MIIQCKSCDKKFTVPDNAIGENGRLVQCSSCGNKWTQFPIGEKNKQIIKTNEKKVSEKVSKKIVDKNKKNKSTRSSGPTIYTEEYLKKKHGIRLSEALEETKTKYKKKENKGYVGLGFYNSIIIMIAILVFFFGTPHVTKDLIISNYPFMEIYIIYLYETLSNIQIIVKDFIANY